MTSQIFVIDFHLQAERFQFLQYLLSLWKVIIRIRIVFTIYPPIETNTLISSNIHPALESFYICLISINEDTIYFQNNVRNSHGREAY